MTRSFAAPVALPVFLDGQRKPFDVWCNGCRELRSIYDGCQNRVEIIPLASHPDFIGLVAPMEVGQSYTISERQLTRRILEGLYPPAPPKPA